MMQTETNGRTPEILVDALHKGLGRTFELVNAQNHALYREFILDACIHSFVYDPQNEEDRAQWLFDLLRHIDGIEFYQHDILAALEQVVEPDDKRQLLRLTAKLALHHADALAALFRQVVAQLPLHGEQLLVSLLLGLAQRNGLADAERAIGDYLRARAATPSAPATKVDHTFLDLISQQIGSSEIVDILQEWMDGSARFKTEENIVEVWINDDEFNGEQQVDSEVQRMFDEHLSETTSPELVGLRRIIDDEMLHDRTLFAEWGRSIVAEQDLATVFEWFQREERTEIQTRYLWIFEDVPLPHVDYKVLCLAAMGDCVERQAAAVRALYGVKDNRVRDLAFTLLKTCPSISTSPNVGAYNTVRLFVENYQSEDAVYILRALAPPQDREQCYQLCEDILQLGTAYDDPELSDLLLWAYEHTPSSNTRFEIVRLLHDREVRLSHLFEEARYDCDSGTRMFATSALELAEM